MSFKLHVILSSVMKSGAILLHPGHEVNHPCYICYLSLSHLTFSVRDRPHSHNLYYIQYLVTIVLFN